SDAAPIHHYRLGRTLDEVLDPGTIVIGDGGDVVAAVSRVLRIHRPGHWLDPGPFGCLGIGPPYALGVKAAKPDKQVVVVAGDGAGAGGRVGGTGHRERDARPAGGGGARLPWNVGLRQLVAGWAEPGSARREPKQLRNAMKEGLPRSHAPRVLERRREAL